MLFLFSLCGEVAFTAVPRKLAIVAPALGKTPNARARKLCKNTPMSEQITIGVELTINVPWLLSAFPIKFRWPCHYHRLTCF